MYPSSEALKECGLVSTPPQETKKLRFYSWWYEDIESRDLTFRVSTDSVVGGGLERRYVTVDFDLASNSFTIRTVTDEQEVAVGNILAVMSKTGGMVEVSAVGAWGNKWRLRESWRLWPAAGAAGWTDMGVGCAQLGVRGTGWGQWHATGRPRHGANSLGHHQGAASTSSVATSPHFSPPARCGTCTWAPPSTSWAARCPCSRPTWRRPCGTSSTPSGCSSSRGSCWWVAAVAEAGAGRSDGWLGGPVRGGVSLGGLLCHALHPHAYFSLCPGTPCRRSFRSTGLARTRRQWPLTARTRWGCGG